MRTADGEKEWKKAPRKINESGREGVEAVKARKKKKNKKGEERNESMKVSRRNLKYIYIYEAKETEAIINRCSFSLSFWLYVYRHIGKSSFCPPLEGKRDRERNGDLVKSRILAKWMNE